MAESPLGRTCLLLRRTVFRLGLKVPGEEVTVELEREMFLVRLQPAPGVGRQRQSLAGLVCDHAARVRVERARRPDRIAGAKLIEPRTGIVVCRGPAGGQQLQAFVRRIRAGERLARGIVARMQPLSEVRDQVLELNLPVQVALQAFAGVLQYFRAPLGCRVYVRSPGRDDDVLAALERAVRIRLHLQLGERGRRQGTLQPDPQRLGDPAQNHPNPGRVSSLQEPAEDTDRREVEAGDAG